MMQKKEIKNTKAVYLLVEPDFPITAKSKNHANFLPIGLLKIAAFFRSQGHKVVLVRGNTPVKLTPDRIYITSLFTYWAKYVGESISYYKKRYPKSRIIVGGILASLMPELCKKMGADEVHHGLHEKAEKYALLHGPAYDLVDKYGVGYQIVHAMRGCIRKCNFCGTWKIEDRSDTSIDLLIANIIKCGTKGLIGKNERNKIIFYDNNFLAHKEIVRFLKILALININNKRITCESQSGFDGRLLTPEIAKLIKKAGFINPRIAWDHGYNQNKSIKKQIDMLSDAGYPKKEIYVFMIFNYFYDYQEMKKKLDKCRKWGVQVADCRYRPLNQTYDNYKPRTIGQTNKDYYIYNKWTDAEVKLFRRNVREQNICIRHGFKKYVHELECLAARDKRESKGAKRLTSLPSKRLISQTIHTKQKKSLRIAVAVGI